MSEHIRNEVAKVVKKTQLGPYWGCEEVLPYNPLELYNTGILYPKNITEEEEERINSSSKYDELTLATDYKPSAIGITSIHSSRENSINCSIEFGKYNAIKVDEIRNWKRTQHQLEIEILANLDEISVRTLDGTIKEKHPQRIYFTIFESLDIYITKKTLPRSKGLFTLTISIVNANSKGRPPESLIFQPKIELSSKSPLFRSFDFPDGTIDTSNNEEINRKLLYRNYLSFASGHGCSVNWNTPPKNENATDRIYTEVIPDININGNDFNRVDSEVLYMKRLAGKDYAAKREVGVSKKKVISELYEFISHYEEWIESQKDKAEDLEGISKFNTAAKKLLTSQAHKNVLECRKLHGRMEKGVQLLEREPLIFKAFSMANQAMFEQRAMDYSIKEEKRDKEKDILEPGRDDYKIKDFKEAYHYDHDGGYLAKWRPFQLAFILAQLPGLTDDQSFDREIVDLIWFTTGGGKTEAYLGVMAFSILYRRLKAKEFEGDPDLGAGVTSIMRYTLRLLNLQQFSRAATLICALELIRRENETDLGKINIGIGIWVGSSLTPNKWGDKSNTSYNDYNASSFFPSLYALNKGEKPKYRLPVSECPLCGINLESENNLGLTGEFYKGNYLYSAPFHMYCPNTKCSFFLTKDEKKHDNLVKKKRLPIYFVDEHIYEEYPSLVIATADKFASLAWNSECFNIFNIVLGEKETKRKYSPPDLIIQDELHLINSSLGTIFGVYELAIDVLTKDRFHKPKIIAATATANNSEYQCKILFNRTSFSQFPPFGTDIDDSFFSKKKKIDQNARKYIGIQPTGFTSTIGQIRLVSVLQSLVPSLPFSNDEIDNYYTNLIYFNTKRELGKFRTLLEDDINKYMDSLTEFFGTMNFGYRPKMYKELSGDIDSEEIRKNLSILESSKLPESFDESGLIKFGVRRNEDLQHLLRISKNDFFFKKTKQGPAGLFVSLYNKKELYKSLDLPFKAGESYEDIASNLKSFRAKLKSFKIPDRDVPQTVPATSMVSVGIDIPRFNIIQITGQPKTHADYIQTSSRVGRNAPGLVITTFNPAYNRDRSHYEKFIDYHQGYYKFVEPTTVTPYSKEALEKALPAVIFILMKYKYYGSSNNATLDKKSKEIFTNLAFELKTTVSNTLSSIDWLGEEEKNDYLKNFAHILESIYNRWELLSEEISDLTFPNYSTQNKTPENLSHIFVNPVYDSSEYKKQFKCMNNIRSVEENVKIELMPRSL